MEQLLEFAGNHPLLVGDFFAVLTALAWNLLSDPGGKNAVDPMAALIHDQSGRGAQLQVSGIEPRPGIASRIDSGQPIVPGATRADREGHHKKEDSRSKTGCNHEQTNLDGRWNPA